MPSRKVATATRRETQEERIRALDSSDILWIARKRATRIHEAERRVIEAAKAWAAEPMYERSLRPRLVDAVRALLEAEK